MNNKKRIKEIKEIEAKTKQWNIFKDKEVLGNVLAEILGQLGENEYFELRGDLSELGSKLQPWIEALIEYKHTSELNRRMEEHDKRVYKKCRKLKLNASKTLGFTVVDTLMLKVIQAEDRESLLERKENDIKEGGL